MYKLFYVVNKYMSTYFQQNVARGKIYYHKANKTLIFFSKNFFKLEQTSIFLAKFKHSLINQF